MDCSDEVSASDYLSGSDGLKKTRQEGSAITPKYHPADSKSHNGNGSRSAKLAFQNFAARNLNEVNFTDLLKFDDNGIKHSEFQTSVSSSSATCAKEATHNLQNIMDFISTPKENKVDALGRADICRIVGNPRLTANKGNLREIYGFEIGNETYLHAEEALYLLERGKLEIFCDHVCLSVERARALLLHSKSFPDSQSSNVKTCDIDEYAVYKYLARLGMRVRRHNNESVGPENRNTLSSECNVTSSEPSETNESMDIADNEETHETPFQSSTWAEDNRGIKRKLDDTTDLSCEVEPESSLKTDEEEMESSDKVASMPSFGESDSYTVVEVDSDVEIEDMTADNNRVVIEEVPDEFYVEASSPREEMPCSSKSARFNFEPQVFVDLPSSDSESEDEKGYMNQIWSKFVPGVSLQIGFPPSHLLPTSIGSRKEECQYSFTAQSSDVDLECFVDELDLNESPTDQGQKIYCNSWTEWRQIMMQEAKQVRDTSLLASSDYNLQNVSEKLNLWDKNTAAESTQPFLDKKDCHKFSIIFDIYSQSYRTIHKRRLATRHLPSFHLAIVRSDEPIPHLKELSPLENDIPIVIAIVSDENEILFLTPESVPLTSLF